MPPPTWERFQNAPIVEALLDIQVTVPAPVELTRLESFHDAIRNRYPIKQGRVRWEGQFSIADQAVQQAVKREPEGFMFRSADDHRLVQVRQGGFTFNWLKPYDRWESFRDEAKEHWPRYRELVRAEAVTRLGLRYINRLELPLPFSDFREYIRIAPDLPPELPQGLSALFMRFEIPHEARDLVAIVTETMQPVIDEGRRLPLIFDIDVVRHATLDSNSPAIWDSFEEMHEYKNKIFFTSVTDRAKELFR